MELTFLGTSSGRTCIDRFHSALLFSDDKDHILIDAGDGISKALLASNIKYNSISKIIISHFHSDHLAGLPSLLTQMVIENRNELLIIYVHEKLKTRLIEFLNTSFIFISTLKFQINIVAFNFERKYQLNSSFEFYSRQNSHINNKHNLHFEDLFFISSSFKFIINGYKIIYTSDISTVEDLHIFNETGTNYFITEATHLELKEIERAFGRINRKKLYITHIDNLKSAQEWHANLEEESRQKIIIAEDGMKINF